MPEGNVYDSDFLWTMTCTLAEPSDTLFEYGMYVGINLQDILYGESRVIRVESRGLTDQLLGIELLLYFRTMRVFFARRRRPHKSDTFYAIFSTVMFILITVWVTAVSSFGQRIWLLHRNYPGGPMAYHKANSSGLHMDLGRFSLAILQQMADALMVRCSASSLAQDASLNSLCF